VLVMGREKPGAGAVILPESADSDPSRTVELACHASTSSKYVSFFSLSAAKSIAPNLKLLFVKASSVIMVKS